MEWAFEVSSAAPDESTGQQDASPPRGSPNRADCFIYPGFTQSAACFSMSKSIMLESKSTSMTTLTNSIDFV